MSRYFRLLTRIIVAGALAAAAVHVLVRFTRGERGVGSPPRTPGVGPAPAVPDADPGPLLTIPSSEPTLRVGPAVPEDAWIEVEVGEPSAGAWEVAFASSPDAGPALRARREPDGLFSMTIPGRPAETGDSFREPPGGACRRLWIRRRGDDCSVWLDGVERFRSRVSLAGDVRVVFESEAGPVLKRLSVREARDPAFADDFMREGPDETWTALRGVWEVALVHFPERSANAFALFARFPGLEPSDPFVENRWQKAKPGIGVHLSSWRGVVQVERITGNGPAREAGIREHDIVLSIDGTDYRSVSPFTFFEDLEGPAGSTVKLTVLRPGELRPRSYSLKRRRYRWAKGAAGQPIAPGAAGRGVAEESLAAAGEPWWDGYRYEASVACAGAGGAGLAFAVRDKRNYHCFAMVGDTWDANGADLRPSRLALFRVRGGERAVLAEREWGPLAGTYYRLAVDLEGERMRTFLDGAPVFDVSDSDLPAGRIGAWALRGAGAYFDDVAVSTDRAATAPPEYVRPTAVYADEIDMRVWANPADEWEPDPDSEWWWNIYRFPGDMMKMRVTPGAKYHAFEAVLGAGRRFDRLEKYRRGDEKSWRTAPVSGVLFGAESRGYRLRCAPVGPDTRVARPDREAETTFALGVDDVASVAHGGTALREERIRHGHRGDAVAMKGLENIDEPGVIQVTSSGVRDYYFRRAPVDWAVAAGKWGILNKWICDPRFSWFGGHSRSLAAVWNKRASGGDVTLDFYAALVMIIDDPPYERVGDFNCAILADGRSFDSGYALVVSGGRNRWARLYGAGKLLAESRDAADRLPSNVAREQPRRFLHQRWFRITLERVEGRVRYLLDGREVFNVPDTLGVESGHCGLWTQDNGMLVARARVAADTWEDAARGGEIACGATVARQEVEGLTNLVMGEVGAEMRLDGAGPSGAPAVRVTNAQPGGAFAVASSAEVSGAKRLSFDFRAEPGAKVDLYFMPPEINAGELGPCRVRLTGPEGLNLRHPVLAGPLAEADGGWHHVELHPDRLFESYAARQVLPRPPRISGLRAVICNLEEGEGADYLPCGIGGNGPGTSYWVSALRIEDERAADREPPRVKELLLPGEKDVPPDRVRVLFEDDCSGVDERSMAIAFTPLYEEEGEEDRNGGPGAPPAGRESVFRAGSYVLSYDALTQAVEVDLTSVGALPRPGRTVMIEVRDYRDRSGKRGEPALRAWRTGAGPRRLDAPHAGEMQDVTGPELVRFEFLPTIPGEVDLDFEKGPRTYRELRRRLGGEAPVMSLDTDTPSGEGASLRITASVLKSDCLFRVHDGPADLAQLPGLSFDYRLPPETPVNLVVCGRKSFHGVVFSDVHDPVSEWSHHIKYAGEFEGVLTDGRWHHAELDLARLMQRAYPRQTSFIAGGIYLCDWGWNGLWPGDGYQIDNLRVEGVRRGRDVAVTWRAYDVSGVEKAAWALDTSPDTDPLTAGEDGRANARPCLALHAARLPEAAELPDGAAYFHLRLADSLGNWSPTFHKRLLVDNAPPRVVRVSPPDGASSPALEVSVTLEDYSGVDPLSVRLEVAGTQYRVDRRACLFDRARGILRWSARGAGAAGAFEPGRRVDVRLVSARDVVGNELALEYEWSWTYDPSLDDTPPPTPRARVTTGRRPTSFIDGPTFTDTNDFERELGPVERGRGCEVALSRAAAREGSQGCRITVTPERRGCFTLRLRERYWYADERPYLALDYRFPAQTERLAVKIDLLRQTREREMIGRGAGVLKADGAWHHVVIDLGRHLDGGTEWPVFKGRALKLAGPVYLAGRARPGTVLDIDNVEFVRRDWRGAAVEIAVPRRAENESAVVGFSVLWDRRPEAIPPEIVTHRIPPWLAGETFRVTSLPPPRGAGAPNARGVPGGTDGPPRLHVRSVDGAGNWSGTRHLDVDFDGR